MSNANERPPWRFSFFAAAALLGMAPFGEGCGPCGDLMPAYRTHPYSEPKSPPVPEEVRVEVTDTAFLITYTTKFVPTDKIDPIDPPDSTWEVEYRRVENPAWYED